MRTSPDLVNFLYRQQAQPSSRSEGRLRSEVEVQPGQERGQGASGLGLRGSVEKEIEQEEIRKGLGLGRSAAV